MLSKKITEALNEQINKEMYSAYLYLSMSAYSSHEGFDGFASWFRLQANEEMEHAMKIYDYINEHGMKVELKSIDEPEENFKSPVDLFEKTLAHEKKVTESINNIVDLAIKENDHATHVFLQWFVTEQVEEEASADEILTRLKLFGKDGRGLFMIDRELGERKSD